jgi:hypothetical protein
MTNTVIPVTKAIYVCDEVVEDPTSRKVHFLGIFNAVRPASPAAYPFRLGQMCVVAQLIDGLDEIPIRSEIVRAETEEVVYSSAEQRLRFPQRHTTVFACFRIRNCPFPQPGVYFVELYCGDVLLDDRTLHLLPEEVEP